MNTAQLEMTDPEGPTFRITLREDGAVTDTIPDLSMWDAMKIWNQLFPPWGEALREIQQGIM